MRFHGWDVQARHLILDGGQSWCLAVNSTRACLRRGVLREDGSCGENSSTRAPRPFGALSAMSGSPVSSRSAHTRWDHLNESTRRSNKMIKKVLMCPPTYFDIEYSINPYM